VVWLEAEPMRSLRRWQEVAGLFALLGAACTVDASTTGKSGDPGSGGARGLGSTGLGGLGGASVMAGSAGAAGSQSTDAAGATDVTSTPGVGDAGVPVDGARADTSEGDSSVPDAARSNRILIYGVTSPLAYRHASIPVAAAAMARAAAAAGLTVDAIGTETMSNVVTRSVFTADSLSGYGAIILLANDGEPFGYPADQEIQNLTDYVRKGGALVGIECVTDCYGGAVSGPMTNHPPSVPFHALLGATFLGHPGDLAPATCTKTGDHPSVAQLGMSFKVTDEIYAFTNFRSDNVVVLNCTSSTDARTVRPIAWVREEGLGRVFHTALGHPDASWKMPMDPNVPSRLVEDHVLPGLLWAMRR
jgi:type 1 glutamine amidotransferase